MMFRAYTPDDSPQTYENQVMGALSTLHKRPTVDELCALFPKFWKEEYIGAVRRLVLSGRLEMDKDWRLGR